MGGVLLKGKIVFGSLFVIIMLVFIATLPALIIKNTASATESSHAQSIATVDVSDLDEQEIVTTLQLAIDDWLSSPVYLKDVEQELRLTAADLQFDIASTVAAYQAANKKGFWKKVVSPSEKLHVTASEELQNKITAMNTWDEEATLQTVLQQASNLGETTINAVLREGYELESFTLATVNLQPPADIEELPTIAATLNDMVIVPGEAQQLVPMLQDITVNQATLDFVATAVYYAVLQTDYAVLERYPQLTKPSYIEQGLEASIDKAGFKDVVFINEGATASVLKVSFRNGVFTVMIKAPDEDAKVTLKVINDQAIAPKTLYRYSRSLAPGVEQVLEQGKNGSRIEIVRMIEQDGKVREEVVGKDYYPPANRIVLVSTTQPVLKEQTTATTTVQTGTVKPPNKPQVLPTKTDGTPDTSEDNGSGDSAVTTEGYYDKAGNFHSTK